MGSEGLNVYVCAYVLINTSEPETHEVLCHILKSTGVFGKSVWTKNYNTYKWYIKPWQCIAYTDNVGLDYKRTFICVKRWHPLLGWLLGTEAYLTLSLSAKSQVPKDICSSAFPFRFVEGEDIC